MISKNGAGILVLALSLIGVNVDPNTTIAFISAVGTVISFFLLVWNQIQREDVHLFFWKK